MSSAKKEKNKKKAEQAPNEEPEICLFQIPTFKPKAFKSEDDLSGLKTDKTMDIKVFEDGVRFYSQGKKKVKYTIPYDELNDIKLVEGSPELVRLITKSNGKKKCYQVTIVDDVNREKLLGIFNEKRGGQTPSTVTNSEKEPVSSKHGSPTLKNQGFATSEVSRKMPYERNYNYNSNTHYDPPNKYKSAKLNSGLKSGSVGRNSEVVFDWGTRSATVNADYDQEEDDFNSINDQMTQSLYHGYDPSRRHESSYYARSRISHEPEYIDDDYGEHTSGYDYDSGYSDATVVARPVRPRPLTFYTPFTRVTANRAPHY